MPNRFVFEIDNISFEFHTMNVKKAQLFQVYVDINGQKKRYHIKDDGKGNFVFALRDDAPKELLIHEAELDARIKQLYNLPVL